MEIRDMSVEELETRKAEIREAIEASDADLDALETEARSINEEIESRTLAEAKKAEIRKAVAEGTANTTIIEKKEENPMEEIRSFGVDSPEYRNAFFKVLQRKELTEVEQRAYTTGSGSAGAAIPTETSKELVKKMLETAPLLNEIQLLRVAGNVTVATQLSRDDAYVHGEGNAITASSDALAYVTLAGYEFAKLVQISKAVQTMAIPEFEGWLVDGLAEDLALAIENKIIYGTGTNEPTGLASITWTSGTNLISTTADITYANVCALMTYPEKGLRRNCKFLCNSSFPFTQLAGIKDSQNRPIFVQSMAEGVPSRLMGKEVLISDKVNDDELYFGDFKKIVGNLSRDVEVESSMESSFGKGLIDYRGFAIFDCKVSAPRAFGKFKKN